MGPYSLLDLTIFNSRDQISNAEFVVCSSGCLRGDVAQELNVIACGKRFENAEKLPKVRESQEHRRWKFMYASEVVE